jgi:hypothetical protein
MIWARNVAGMGKKEVYTGFWWGNLRERDHLGDQSVDAKIVLNGSSRIGMLGHGLDRSSSGQGQVEGFCECGNEPSVSKKCGEFFG